MFSLFFIFFVHFLLQEFIGGHADCQENLVAQVLEWGGHYGGLLAPHFTPAVTPVHTYLTLYSSLTPHALVSPDHTFMLLSKVSLIESSVLLFNCFFALVYLYLHIFCSSHKKLCILCFCKIYKLDSDDY